MIRKQPFTFFALVVLLIGTTFAQPAVTIKPSSPADRVALYQALLDLSNPWTVMCVAAHPDDEDGTSLIVMRRKYGAHTASLFSTFDEGGQNAIGPDLYEELGAIRARETRAASEIQGSEPHFLGLKDFGFSKSADETFQKWGHEEALRRMVLEIRKLRPDVIITNHSVTSNDHGHHQATARLIVEAFDAAADPKRFPEQLKDGVDTWQVQRLFVRVRGQNAPGQAGAGPLVTIDPNEQDPVRGTTFAEQALSALQKHATQGPWPKTVAQMAARFANQSDGRLPLIRYRIERQAKSASMLPTQPLTFLDNLSLPDAVLARIQPPLIDGRPLTEFVDQPEKVLNALLDSIKSNRAGMAGAVDRHRAVRMKTLLDDAVSKSAGLHIGITPQSSVLARGSTTTFSVQISNKGSESPWLIATQSDATEVGGNGGPERFMNIRDLSPIELHPGATQTFKFNHTVKSDAPITVPQAEHLYDGRLHSQFAIMDVAAKIRGVEVHLPVSTWFDVAAPLEISEISPSPIVLLPPRVGVSSAGADLSPTTPPQVRLKVINHLKRSFKGEVAFGFENRSPESRVRVDLLPEQTTTLTVTLPNTEENRAAHLRRPEFANSLWFSLRNAGLHETLIKRSVRVVWLDAKVSQKLSVGYVRGFDFSLPNALTESGVEAKELSAVDVKNADLGKFTSIIVDNRVYESQPELIAANQKLLDYAKNSGTLMIFYHKSDEWNRVPKRTRPQLAPYKLIVGNDRVTDENAAITFLEPDHPLLNSPNKMGPEDFVGWIQERGVYYPKEWDSQFHALLESNDPGEAPLKSGLLVADYGKGKYIYTSMVWYRQLRAGVPGAYRMLANMISYGGEK